MAYRVEIGGSKWSRGPVREVSSITAARRLAEEYGTSAEWAYIYKGEKLVALHRRDPNGGGWRWYKACIGKAGV